MKKQLAGLLFLASMAVPSHAQTRQSPFSDTFTFSTGVVINRYTVPPTGGAITSWDGVPNAYPENMGGISFSGYSAGIGAPWQLGYLNNGDLYPCDPMAWGPKIFTVGDGTHNGDQFSMTGSTTCPYFTGEYGTYLNSNNRLDGFSVVANYTVFKYTSCYRGRCGTFTEYFLTGGTGTVTDSLINQ